MFKRVDSLLLGHKTLLEECETEIYSIFKDFLERRFDQYFNDFLKNYFEGFGNKQVLEDFLKTLPQETIITDKIKDLEKELKPKSKSVKLLKKQKSLGELVNEFKNAREDLLKSWDYIANIAKRFISDKTPDITLGHVNTVYRQFSSKYEKLFDEDNIFGCAIEFLLSSFRESCKNVLGYLPILIDYSQIQENNRELKRQIETLNSHFNTAKEIAHNSDISLNWENLITFDQHPRYEFIAQDLLKGYSFAVIGVRQDEIKTIGEIKFPSFLEFLKSINLSGQKAVFSAVPSTTYLDKL